MAKSTYEDWLKQDFGGMIDALELEELRKHALRSRWLDQTLWMENQAQKARLGYQTLRLTAIVGGVIIPALVSLDIAGQAALWVRLTVIVLSLLVAISAAVQDFFHFGERWRHYRRLAETLKSEGWAFFQMAGPYRRYTGHNEAYLRFAQRVEEISQQDIEAYAAEMMLEAQGKEEAAVAGGV